MKPYKRLLIIGLDCATPELIFDRYADAMPHLTALRASSTWGPLRSTIPPITTPAWMCMFSGRDPGQLGIYGFRNRSDHSYTGLRIASSKSVTAPLLWDIAGKAGLSSIVFAVPLTYPPRPINGSMISCFLTPGPDSEYTSPPALKSEIIATAGRYIADVEGFRSDNKHKLLADIHAMTDNHFTIARHLIATRDWNVFVMVEMGPDRIHHGFWKYCDPSHPRFVPGNEFENAMRDYYSALDAHAAALIALAGPDTAVMIVSDHGARPMIGGFCINEWLIQKGYLTLRQRPQSPTRIEKCDIDWTRTKVWGDGGYYGRIFINLEGREPQGIVPAAHYESFRAALAAEIESIPDESGASLGNRAFRPQEIYGDCRNIPPDLIVYFGDLAWRSVGSVGHPSCYTHENDTGPDDANHAQHGIFTIHTPGTPGLGHISGADILDCLPTMSALLGIPIPAGLEGRNLLDSYPKPKSGNK